MTEEPWSFLWIGGVGCLVAALLVSARMMLSSMSGGTIRKLELRDGDLAERLEKWYNQLDDFRITIRLLLIADLILIALAWAAWDKSYSSGANAWCPSLLPLLCGAAFFLVVTESLGKHLSALASARFLSVAIPVIRLTGILVAPLAIPFSAWHRLAERWQETLAEGEERATAEDEIMSLVEQDALGEDDESTLEADERRMIRGIFDLDETLVHEIMTPRVDVDAVRDAASVADVKAKVIESGHSRIPVFHGTVDHITGVVYAKDLLDDKRLDGVTSIESLFHRPVFIPETKNVGDLLTEFQQNSNHFAIVLDEYGGTAGIVTFEDILEEIVGEIRDEYDTNESVPCKQILPDGNVIVDARISIDELNEILGIDLPEDEDYDTLGGYISTCSGRIPKAGEIVETDGLILEVISADPRRVLKAKVRRKEGTMETASE